VVGQFEGEVKTQAQLPAHPNVVIAFDADEHDGRPFLVMESVKGTDLDRHVKQAGRCPSPRPVPSSARPPQGRGGAAARRHPHYWPAFGLYGDWR
jgi:hypothetical protein